jgi:DNA-binding transcriptional MerR regulator
MEYTIKELSSIANISTRTLRYYDQINLLKPNYINKSNYRVYTSLEVDILQQILFFKELGMSLSNISSIINSNDFDKLESLNEHYKKLEEKQMKTNMLLNNIQKTISNIKGEKTMSDKEKFEGFKEKIIQENTDKYGKELDEKYGKEYVEEANMKYKKLSKYQIKEQNELSNKINTLLIEAVESNDIKNEVSMELCKSHQLWIQSYWPTYSKEAHMNLVEMYLIDERFKEYYEKIVEGGTLFLRDAMKYYLTKK